MFSVREKMESGCAVLKIPLRLTNMYWL